MAIADYVTGILRDLDEMGIRYALLHRSDCVLRGESDVDLVIARNDLPKLESYLGAQHYVVQVLHYESTSWGYILFFKRGETLKWTVLDVSLDYRWRRRVFFKGEELLEGRIRWKGLWVTAPKMEFAFLLVKKIYEKGGVIPCHQRRRLHELATELGDEARATLVRLLGPSDGEAVLGWIVSEDWDDLEQLTRRLRGKLAWQVIRHDWVNGFRYWLPELKRKCRRWQHPTGLFVAVLGPDGAGKSTLALHIIGKLAGAFRRTAMFHLRPGLVGRKRSAGPVTDPHGKSPYPLWLSILKVPYYFFDYLVGYLLKIRPKLVRSTLVVFDRYYDDLLVDPRRYRYAGPMWLARLAQRFIPKPDLFLILDLPEEQLLSRKQEVSIQECRRQRAAYRRLASELPNAILLDGSQPPEQVARSAQDVLLGYLHERYLKRRHLWFRDDPSEYLDWLPRALGSGSGKLRFVLSTSFWHSGEIGRHTSAGFRWLNLKDGRGYLIPVNSRTAAAEALGLYNAQSFKARAAKRLLATGLKCGTAQPFLRNVKLLVGGDDSYGTGEDVTLLDHLKEVLGRQDLTFGISLGTPGSHRKPVIQIMNRTGRVLGYAKVGWNEETTQLVKNEEVVLNRLSAVPFKTAELPRVIHAGSFEALYLLVLSPPHGRVGKPSQSLSSMHLEFLKELSSYDQTTEPLTGSSFRQTLQDRVRRSEEVSPYHAHILRWGSEAAQKWFADVEVPFAWRHGDFAPWNTWISNGKLFVFDWEYAQSGSPPGWDAFHFLVQTGLLLRRWKPEVILQSIFENATVREYLVRGGLGTEWLPRLLLLYLLDVLSWELMRSGNRADLAELRMRDAWRRVLAIILLREKLSTT